MNTAAISLSAGSFVVVMTTLVTYFRTIPRGKVPVSVVGLQLRLWFGLGLAGSAIAWSVWSGSLGAAVIAPAAFATMNGAFVLWLLRNRATPVGDLKVEVGDKLLPFGATTSDGSTFHSDSLAGKRTLLKFFRGGW
jgi:hypothetical protein